MEVWLRLELFYADYIKAFTFSRERLSAVHSLPFAECGVELMQSLCLGVCMLPMNEGGESPLHLVKIRPRLNW